MFSRSKTKRFTDSVSCAPPPGHYNIKDIKTINLASFQKSQRWRADENGQSSITNNSSDSLKNSSSNSNFSINKTFAPKLQSSVKKKANFSSNLKIEQTPDACRKSLVADVEFQQSKVNALLQKIKSLEIQVEGSKSHSLDIEKSNEKLHDIIKELRQEKCCARAENEVLEERIQVLNQEQLAMDKELAEQNSMAQRKLEEETELHINEKEELIRKLEVAQELNCDFREQLESIESTMTDNMRGISEKYETLEETFDTVQSDYKLKLERSNSLVEKIKEAHESSKHDLDVMQDVYNNLKEDYETYKIEVLQRNSQYEEEESRLKEEIKGYLTKIEEITSANSLTALTYQEEKDKNQRLTEKINELELSFKTLVNELNEQKEGYQILLLQNNDVNEQLRTNEKINNSLNGELGMLKLNLVELQKEKDVEKSNHVKETQNFERENIELQDQINTITEVLKQQVDESTLKSQAFETEIERLQTTLHDKEIECKDQHKDFRKNFHVVQSELEATKQQLKTLEDNPRIFDETKIQELQDNLERWQNKYSNLENKVGPFMSQLEQFELEKQSLLSENASTQSEMSKLSDKYAQILGHQNNKQKIHHIRKLKEENLSLKAEVTKLRADLTREKKRKHHVDSKNAQHNKLDHSKAFQHEGKENMSSREPLKLSNS